MKRLLSMFISIALMATSVLCVDFSAAAADDELTALAAGSDTYKAYYYLNFSDYAYFLNTYRSVYQTNLESLADNKPYQALLTAWRVATFNIASEVDYAKKEIGYYETLLFDLLYDEQSGTIFQSFMSEYSDLTKTANSVQKALSASTFKKVSDLYGKIAKDTPATDPQYLEALKVLKNCSTVSEAANLLGDISTLTDYAGTFYELVENMCKVQVVLDSAKEINLLLDEISKKSNDNIALQTAIAEFKGFTDDTVDRSFAVAVFSGETVLAEGLKYVAKKIYKSVLERANLYGLAVGVGQAVGKFSADTLFGTSDSVNSYYHLRAVFRFETLLRQVVQSLSTRSDVTINTATAKQFNTGVVLLCKTYIAGLKEYKKFIQKNYHSGTLGDYVNGIPDAEYEQLMTSVDDLIASIKSAIAFNESVANRLYAENVQVYADEIYQMQIPTIDTGISEESYTSGLSTIKRVSTSYAGVIEKDTTLSANTVMYGDVCIKGSLDLNGYDLTVTGSLNHIYGDLTLNGGTLNVGKDYIGAKVVTSAEGKKEYLFNGNSSGQWHGLYMKNANDKMTVGGNFIECENGETNKGVLRVGGNVESYNGFDYGAEHKTVLTGTQDQKIYGSASIKFGQLEVENTDSRQFNATQYFGAKKLLSDMTIKPDNLQITQLDANGHTVNVLGGLTDIKSVMLNNGKLSVNGDAVISGDAFDLSGGIATFTGSLNHTYGELTLNGGTLNVGKDYIGAKVVTNAEGKKEYLRNGNWHDLYMKNANDRMTVGGNFIECENGEMSKGVLRIGGNVESYNGFNFDTEHKTILDGQQHQTITLPTDSHFGTLQLTKDVSNYTFEPEACWFKVIYADCAHQYVHKVLQPATCTSDGRERCTCTICGQVKEVLIPATAHDYQSEVVAATCSQSGYTQYTCTVCGYSYRTDYTQPGAHSFVKTTVAATCTAAGYDCYTCSVCGSAYTTGFTAPLGHDLQVIQTDDQSESNGHIFEYLRCARCMDTATDTIRTTHVTDASGHYVWKAGCYQDQVVQAGDCTHKKIVVRVCTVEDPTGTGTCTAQLRTESEAPGHRVEQWTVTLDPTCATDGQRTGTCTVCREEVHQVIAAAPEYGHIFQYSGSEPGVCIYTCTRCGVTERRRADVVEAQFFDHMGAADKSALGYVYDLNQDGVINLRDYVLLQRIAVGGTE